MFRLPLLEENTTLLTNHLVGMSCQGENLALVHRMRIPKAIAGFNVSFSMPSNSPRLVHILVLHVAGHGGRREPGIQEFPYRPLASSNSATLAKVPQWTFGATRSSPAIMMSHGYELRMEIVEQILVPGEVPVK